MEGLKRGSLCSEGFKKLIIDLSHFLICIVTKVRRYMQKNIQKAVEINFAKSDLNH